MTIAAAGILFQPTVQAAQEMADRDMEMLRFFEHVTRDAEAGTSETRGWDDIWQENGIANDHDQTTATALRYSLAFSAYAVATTSFVFTPAYPGLASKILKQIFDKMLKKRVWSYWNKPGVCGQPWVEYCRLTNGSQASVQASRYPWQPRSPYPADPVASANIMYSGHLAQVAVLYEAFSGNTSLSAAGWSFDDSDPAMPRYTLGSLVQAMADNARVNSGLGYGVTCEPGSVFPPCQSHMHAAFRLFVALRRSRRQVQTYSGNSAQFDSEDSADDRLQGLTRGWIHFAYGDNSGNGNAQTSRMPGTAHALFPSPGNNAVERAYRHNSIFKILRIRPAGVLAQNQSRQGLEIPGCAANDAWSLAYLHTYWKESAESTALLERGAHALSVNPGWGKLEKASQGALLDAGCLGAQKPSKRKSMLAVLTTSFVPNVMAQIKTVPGGEANDDNDDHDQNPTPTDRTPRTPTVAPKPSWKVAALDRASQALNYLEYHYGTSFRAGGKPMYFFNASQTGMAVRVTANIAVASALRAVSDPQSVLNSLYGDAGAALSSQRPFLAKVPEHVMVRAAHYHSDGDVDGPGKETGVGGRLNFTLAPQSSGKDLGSIAIELAGLEQLRINEVGVWQTGRELAASYKESQDFKTGIVEVPKQRYLASGADLVFSVKFGGHTKLKK